ncbi:MAG: HD domain-containing protein [Steroidobacteraceae bacterium]
MVLRLPADPIQMQYRRNDYDVTNTIQVSSPDAVRRAVRELYAQTWPYFSFTRLDTAFADFERLYKGQYPGYLGCDTVYHDMQHSLDCTLALARLSVAHDRVQRSEQRLGPERAMLLVITALFHDCGYIREVDAEARNGAELTLSHVSRGAEFLARYLRLVDMGEWIPVATQIIHFTGYELSFDLIHLDNPIDRTAGHLLGTADLIAQMSDRCYLEKCRDRLYPEFILGGIAVSEDAATGQAKIKYGSGLDVLRETPEFVRSIRRSHLDGEFGGVYKHLEVLFNGQNPYIDAIESHLTYLNEILRTERWPLLRRDPPCFTWEKNPVQNIRSLALDKLKNLWAKA